MPTDACARAQTVTVPVWCLAAELNVAVAVADVSPEIVIVADFVPWLTTAGEVTSRSAASAAVSDETVAATEAVAEVVAEVVADVVAEVVADVVAEVVAEAGADAPPEGADEPVFSCDA